MSNFITQEQYNALIECKKANKYANIICSTRCKLGGLKKFKVKNTDIEVNMKCTQSGGMFTGTHCFILAD